MPATHHTRFAGESNYSLVRSIARVAEAGDGLLGDSAAGRDVHRRTIALFSFLMASFFVIQALVLDRIPEGYPSLIVTLFFLGGIQLMALGAVGEYIGRIFLTQNERRSSP